MTVVGALLLTAVYLAGGVISSLRGVAGAVVEPFSWSVDELARPIGHFFAGSVNYSDVVAQNHKLRAELGAAQLQVEEDQADSSALQQLSSQLNLAFVGTLPTTVAQVTTVSPTNFAATVDINRGRNDGVLAGMPVVANGGVVGQVVSTTLHGATVRLITDPNSSVSVTFGAAQVPVLVSGRGVNSGLDVSSIPVTDQVSVGSLLSTSGLEGGTFPAGLPVARVRRITVTPGSSTYEAQVAPTADLAHLDYVDVVLWEPTA